MVAINEVTIPAGGRERLRGRCVDVLRQEPKSRLSAGAAYRDCGAAILAEWVAECDGLEGLVIWPGAQANFSPSFFGCGGGS